MCQWKKKSSGNENQAEKNERKILCYVRNAKLKSWIMRLKRFKAENKIS